MSPVASPETRRAMLESFSERAATWDRDLKRDALIGDIAAAIRRTIPLDASTAVLDYGCGTGALTFELLPHVGQIHAVDASAGMVAETIRKRGAILSSRDAARLKVSKLDLVENEAPSGRFNLIVACLVMHHIDEVSRVLESFNYLLADQGWLVIVEWATVSSTNSSTFPPNSPREQKKAGSPKGPPLAPSKNRVLTLSPI